ncbi:MAG TPA: cbb3-type cytochrome oxidase assembly protein CcoS [Polyangiaceae bacterium]|jgi:cbb3-type cytochrome oxidase maturation protein
MNIIFLILPLTLVLSVASVAAFAWATRSGQFDDLKTPALRILHEDVAPKSANVKTRPLR